MEKRNSCLRHSLVYVLILHWSVTFVLSEVYDQDSVANSNSEAGQAVVIAKK